MIGNNDEKTKKKHKAWKVMLLIIATFILAVVLLNQVTVYTFVYPFRFLTGLTKVQGNTGPYDEIIANVPQGERISISIDGYPDAYVTFYGESDDEVKPLIIYIHGGGWLSGNAEAVSPFAKLLSTNGFIVANVDYSLAPEYPYPASTVQLATVLNYLYENADQYHIDQGNIFIGGNSAGAHLSSQLGVLVSDPAYAKEFGVEITVPAGSIRGLLLFNGVYDFYSAGACHFPFWKSISRAYTGSGNLADYEKTGEMSTALHINGDYPATFITVGDADPLRTQTAEMIDALRSKNVPYTALLWDGTGAGLYHDYIYELNTEEAQYAYEAAVQFMQTRLAE